MILTVVPRFAAFDQGVPDPPVVEGPGGHEDLAAPHLPGPESMYRPQVLLIVFTTRLRMAVFSEADLFG